MSFLNNVERIIGAVLAGLVAFFTFKQMGLALIAFLAQTAQRIAG